MSPPLGRFRLPSPNPPRYSAGVCAKQGSPLPCRLTRPLAVFDLEATGISPRADRIVEIALARVSPDGARETHSFRVNPQMPIPPEATAVHGISDADVAECPTFKQIAEDVHRLFEDCDMAGFNLLRFDIPMLTEEFLRAGIRFDVEAHRVIDVQRIFHRREPRDLSAALAFYCGELHLDAHGAEADVNATIRVLEGQFERYADLPRTVEELDDYCNPRDPSWVDRTGRLRWADGEIAINFGRKKGATLRGLIADDPKFVNWILRSDFPRDTREIIEGALRGTWPEAPAAVSSPQS